MKIHNHIDGAEFLDSKKVSIIKDILGATADLEKKISKPNIYA